MLDVGKLSQSLDEGRWQGFSRQVDGLNRWGHPIHIQQFSEDAGNGVNQGDGFSCWVFGQGDRIFGQHHTAAPAQGHK